MTSTGTMGNDNREETTIMEYTQTIDATDFWSWKKIEAGHYVLTTDTRYTATVRKDEYGREWTASAASPSGRVRTGSKWSGYGSMGDAREWALRQIKHLVQQDETELLANSLRSGTSRLTSGMTMTGSGDTEAWFTIEGIHHTYKVTVERWNG